MLTEITAREALDKVVSKFGGKIEARNGEIRVKCPACGHRGCWIKNGDKRPVIGWCGHCTQNDQVQAKIDAVLCNGAVAIHPEPEAPSEPTVPPPLGWPSGWVSISRNTWETIRDFRRARGAGYTPALETLHKFDVREKLGYAGSLHAQVAFPYMIAGRMFNLKVLTNATEKKYYQSKDTPRAQDVLFGLDRIFQANLNTPQPIAPEPPYDYLSILDFGFDGSLSRFHTVFLVEGEWDAMCLAECGYTAMAFLNAGQSTIGSTEITLLGNADRIVLIQDNDAPDHTGKRKGEELCVRMKGLIRPEPTILKLAPGVKDPCQLYSTLGHVGFTRAIDNYLQQTESPRTIRFEEVEKVFEEPLPSFPSVTGPLADLAHALSPSLPFEFKFMAAATFVGEAIAGRIVLGDARYHEPRFYTCLVSPPGLGKTPAIIETRNALAEAIGNTHYLYSVDSGPALVSVLAEHARTLLLPDEMVDLFDKGKQTRDSRNSLLNELLRLYEGHETENTTKENKKLTGQAEILVKDARLAVLGGATTTVFEEMWTGTRGGAGGLQDRFLLATTNQKVLPAVQTPSDQQAVERAVTVIRMATEQDFEVMRPAEMTNALNEWWEPLSTQPDTGQRIPALTSRFLLLQTAMHGRRVVDREMLDQAIAFGNYQLAVKRLLMPEDAATLVQAMENAIIKKVKKLAPLSENEIKNAVQPGKKKGGYDVFNRAMLALLRAKALVAVGKNRAGAVIYKVDDGAAELL